MLLSVFRISGHSMEPTIKNGQKVLVSSVHFIFRQPRIGDIVAFRSQGKVFVKRISIIEEDKHFLEGDNEKDSMDSRQFGWIQKDQIVGKVMLGI